jgi:hypothetical protein
MRKARVDFEVTVNGRTYVVPRGSQICVSPTANGQLEDEWDEPQKFDPNRFLIVRAAGPARCPFCAFPSGSPAFRSLLYCCSLTIVCLRCPYPRPSSHLVSSLEGRGGELGGDAGRAAGERGQIQVGALWGWAPPLHRLWLCPAADPLHHEHHFAPVQAGAGFRWVGRGPPCHAWIGVFLTLGRVQASSRPSTSAP